jgi:hypothetical protein
MKKLILAVCLLISSQAFALRTSNAPIITAGDMSGNIASVPVLIDQSQMISIQAVFTGSPTGTLKVQISDDPGKLLSGTPSGIVNWSDYTGSSVAVSAAGNQAFDIWAIGAKWIRIVYTASGGSGSLSATAQTKGP